jgi:Protein of unknown function (DUF3047)
VALTLAWSIACASFMSSKRSLVIWTLMVASAVFLLVRTARASSITYDVVFSDYLGGSTLQWLAKKGFEPKRDATNKSRVVFSTTGSALVLETKKQAAGLLLNEVNIHTYSKIRIRWGVDAFPPGASYAKGVRSESIMVYVFFGSEKIHSGSFLVPDSPYFIGLFLCDSGPVGESFKGRYFQAGGRYVCTDRASQGEEIITEFPIAEAFRPLFGQSHAPAISGLGVGIDTENAKGNGVAKSFISEIELLE